MGTQIPGGVCGGGGGGGLCLKILLSTEMLMETHTPGVVEVEEVGGGGELCLKILLSSEVLMATQIPRGVEGGGGLCLKILTEVLMGHRFQEVKVCGWGGGGLHLKNTDCFPQRY